MLVSLSEIKNIIKEEYKLLEDAMTQNLSHYTIHKAKEGEELGYLGYEPEEMQDRIMQQFSVTANSLVQLIKEIRIMREIAAELANMEAEGYISGAFGQRMWNKMKLIDRKIREFVATWNSLDKIK